MKQPIVHKSNGLELFTDSFVRIADNWCKIKEKGFD